MRCAKVGGGPPFGPAATAAQNSEAAAKDDSKGDSSSRVQICIDPIRDKIHGRTLFKMNKKRLRALAR